MAVGDHDLRHPEGVTAHGEFYDRRLHLHTGVAGAGRPAVARAAGGRRLGALLGWATERFLMRPLCGLRLVGADEGQYAVVVTFGLSLLLINLVDKIVGPTRCVARRCRR
jgi:branched-chain amino acid transport system permease protein